MECLLKCCDTNVDEMGMGANTFEEFSSFEQLAAGKLQRAHWALALRGHQVALLSDIVWIDAALE
jgi:hypothetical protein